MGKIGIEYIEVKTLFRPLSTFVKGYKMRTRITYRRLPSIYKCYAYACFFPLNFWSTAMVFAAFGVDSLFSWFDHNWKCINNTWVVNYIHNFPIRLHGVFFYFLALFPSTLHRNLRFERLFKACVSRLERNIYRSFEIPHVNRKLLLQLFP